MPDEIETYEVLMEATVRKQMHVEGKSPEHAAQIALELCAQPQEMEVPLRPTWIETLEQCEATGELSMEIAGKCSLCGNGIVDRDVPGWPWTYDYRGVNNEDLVCYPCGKGKDG